MAISTLLDKVKAKGVCDLNLGLNLFTPSSVNRLSAALRDLPMLQILDLSKAMLREAMANVAHGLKESRIRLRIILLKDN